MESSRLPGKVMLPVLNKPLLLLMIERLGSVKEISDIIIATTLNSSDDVIEEFALKNKISYFRGSENDVLGRVLDAAKKYKTDIIVEITGDNPLADPPLITELIKEFNNNLNKIDIISTDMGYYNHNEEITFPIGLGGKIFKTNLLDSVSKLTKDPIDREHVVNYILKNSKKYNCINYIAKDKYKRPEIRLTVDYEEDFKLIKNIYEKLYKVNKNFSFIELINYLDDNPEVKKINSECKQKQYNYTK